MDVTYIHNWRNLPGQILEHPDSLLHAAKLSCTHGQAAADVDHNVRVPAVLGFHELVLMLQLLGPAIVGLGYPESLFKFYLCLRNIQRLGI